jgi:uncharacterized protein YegP (UPF0339 family)
MAAKFVLKKGSTGKFRFNLVATNGQVIATSESYESKASAITVSSRSSATPLARRSTTRPTSSLLLHSMPASALPGPAGRSVPGRRGPERRRRPHPDGTGTPMLTRLLTGRAMTPPDERVLDGRTLWRPSSVVAW